MELPKIIHHSWHKYLAPLFADPKMLKIKEDILPNCNFNPAPEDIFKVFSMPMKDIRIVIMGREPTTKGRSTGYAYATHKDSRITSVLSIIKNEIIDNEVTMEDVSDEDWKTLQHWIDQGIFLLNSSLTSQIGIAGKHANYWEWFIKEVLEIISTNCPRVIWVLWGSKVQGFKDSIIGHTIGKSKGLDLEVVPDNNIIIRAVDPTAEIYSNSLKEKFTGCGNFSTINAILQLKREELIYW